MSRGRNKCGEKGWVCDVESQSSLACIFQTVFTFGYMRLPRGRDYKAVRRGREIALDRVGLQREPMTLSTKMASTLFRTVSTLSKNVCRLNNLKTFQHVKPARMMGGFGMGVDLGFNDPHKGKIGQQSQEINESGLRKRKTGVTLTVVLSIGVQFQRTRHWSFFCVFLLSLIYA